MAYLTMILDGYIATTDDRIDWLEAYVLILEEQQDTASISYMLDYMSD
ncbi:hypothetical protein [Macrococcus carouselicus]|nr:hypothetical protein [Macrococcus carouselicus]